MTPIPTIETERLRLRCAELRDFEAYAAFRMDPVRTQGVGGPCSRAAAFDKLGEIIGHWHLRGFGRWIVADKTTDRALGVVGLFHPDDWPEREIAWSVFAEGEGKGIAYEAALASRKYAYEKLGWTTAVSMVTKGNDRSAALALRMGAVLECDYQHPDIGVMEQYRHLSPEDCG